LVRAQRQSEKRIIQIAPISAADREQTGGLCA
jgi:hypothetical protein